MSDDRRARLAGLTERWRERREARRPSVAERPRADPAREARACELFPYRTESPAAYAERHGEAMTGFTYDEEAYADPALDAWLLELGRILRERRLDR